MRAARLSKAALVFAVAVTCSLVACGNIIDPQPNLTFLTHVMKMDTVEANATIEDRAVRNPIAHKAAFALIVLGESLCAFLCWVGAIAMVRANRASAADFRASKAWAIAGLTLAFLLWQTGFMAVGGEYFAMWMSKTWNAVDSAFRFAAIVLGVLIYVALPEDPP